MGQDVIFHDFNTSLEEILKEGAQQLLQRAIENEVQKYLIQGVTGLFLPYKIRLKIRKLQFSSGNC